MVKVSEQQLPEMMMKFFQYSKEKIFVFNKDREIIAMNNSAKEILTDETFVNIIEGHSSAICQVCRGYTSGEELQTCRSCYVLEGNQDRESFQVYFETKNKGIKPFSASFQTIDKENDIRILILRDITEQMKTQKQLYQKLQMKRIIKAQEDERKRISRELHDSVSQELLSLLIELRVTKYMNDSEEIVKRVKKVEQSLASILEDVQHLSVELRPSTLDDLGLEAAFRAHFKLVEKSYGLIVHFDSNIGSKRYQGEVETNIYRICQEAVLNAIKYADVDEINVRLIEDGWLHLHVSDKGKGFLVEENESRGTGLGLYGMNERAQLINGTMSLRSRPNEGTEISVKVPIEREVE